MQDAYPSDGVTTLHIELPGPDAEVLPGLSWGFAGGLFSPAYWASNCRLFNHEVQNLKKPHQLGRTLSEELAACLLGGYGMPAEIGLAAFERLRAMRLLRPGVPVSEMEDALTSPLNVAGRVARYRFPRQKANYLVHCLDQLPRIKSEDCSDTSLRNQLMGLPGIGPKTASWIVRNWRDSDSVAILDIHIIRAMQMVQLIEDVSLPNDYFKVELSFLEFACALDVRPSVLDAVIWSHMRRWGHLAKAPEQIPPKAAYPKRRREHLERPMAVAQDD